VVATETGLTVILQGRNWPLRLVDRLAPPAAGLEAGDRVVAPMPGRVVSVAVASGQRVERGEVLLVLEAMKVQIRLPAPKDGVLGAVNVAAGDLVDDGADLILYADE
jgi:3-methylcrotonyl-CoA carboxylase alpha subunit